MLSLPSQTSALSAENGVCEHLQIFVVVEDVKVGRSEGRTSHPCMPSQLVPRWHPAAELLQSSMAFVWSFACRSRTAVGGRLRNGEQSPRPRPNARRPVSPKPTI